MCPVVLYLTLCLAVFYCTLSFVPWAESSRPCPHLCICYDLSDLVDCRDRGFRHVPRGIPHGSWLLELGGNNLSQISTQAFAGLWSLRVLVLTNCQIQEVEPQVRNFKDNYNSVKAKIINKIAWVVFFIFSPTGLFLFVFSGEARPQLEPADIPPGRLLGQSVCPQRAAAATQQPTAANWVQVGLCCCSAPCLVGVDQLLSGGGRWVRRRPAERRSCDVPVTNRIALRLCFVW